VLYSSYRSPGTLPHYLGLQVNNIRFSPQLNAASLVPRADELCVI